VDTGVTPHAPIQVKEKEPAQFNRDNPYHSIQTSRQICWGNITIKAEIVGKIIGKENQQRISREHNPKIAIFQHIDHKRQPIFIQIISIRYSARKDII